MLKYQNPKNFLLKDILQIGLKKFLRLKKLKIPFHGRVLSVILMVNILLEHFIKNNWKKQTNKNLRLKKWLKEKEISYMSNGKDMIIHLIAGLIKKMLNEILLNEILSNTIPLYKNKLIFS